MLSEPVLTATPKNIFSYDYHVLRGEDRIAFLDLALVRRRGSIIIGEQTLRVEANGILRPQFVLYLDDRPIAEAQKASVFRDRLYLKLGNAECEVRRRGLLGLRFEVLVNEQKVGEIVRLRWYSRKARIDLPEDWPLGLQLFVFWLVVLIWKRDSNSSSH